MDVREAIVTRRSVREYNDKNVGLTTIEEIIDAGRYAPSTGNLQSWRVIVVTDEKTKIRIARIAKKQSWIIQAPVILIICSNKEILEPYYGKRAERYATQNIAAAVQNMLIRANSLGVGSCWIDTFDSKALKRDLRIPDEIDPEIIITLGYSDKKTRSPLKLDIHKLVYFEKWGNLKRESSLIKDIKKEIKRRIIKKIESKKVKT